ncbi:MAG: hypothetical protein ABEJ66_01915, partial [Candidatus Nanohaloarchaea archaeon]
RFRDYYSATTLPLLLTGAALGTGLFLVASNNPQVAKNVRTTAGNILGESVEEAPENAKLLQRQKKAQKIIVRQTSITTVKATKGYVLNRTREEFSTQESQTLLQAFRSAEREVPERIVTATEKSMNSSSIDLSETTKNLVSSNLRGRALLLLIPIITLVLYSLQPLIGFLTAVSATAFSMMMGEN